jgi:hypothetical protein
MRYSIRRSLGVVAGASALLIVTSAFDSVAQEPARSKALVPKTSKKVAPPATDEEDEAPAPKPASKKKSDPRRRLYPYFGQLGLTDEQRESIYQIRAKHAQKIEALEKQLEDARSQAMTEAERVLTPSQKKLLEDRRKAAHAAAESKDASASAGAGDQETKPATTPGTRKRRRARGD